MPAETNDLPSEASAAKLSSSDEILRRDAESFGLHIEFERTAGDELRIRDASEIREKVALLKAQRQQLRESHRQWLTAQAITVLIALCISAPSVWFSYDSAKSSNRSADTADRALELAELERKEAADGSRRSTEIARRAMLAAEKSAAASESSAEQAQSALVIAQRAYLTVKQVKLRNDFQSGAIVDFVVENTGRTPARNVIGRVRGIYAEMARTMEPPIDHSWSGAPVSVTVIGSGDSEGISVGVPRLSAEAASAVNTTKTMVYAYGDFAYDDEFGVRRLTEVCVVYDPKQVVFVKCSVHNTLK